MSLFVFNTCNQPEHDDSQQHNTTPTLACPHIHIRTHTYTIYRLTTVENFNFYLSRWIDFTRPITHNVARCSKLAFGDVMSGQMLRARIHVGVTIAVNHHCGNVTIVASHQFDVLPRVRCCCGRDGVGRASAEALDCGN